jgi:hypothetical protein
MRMRPLLELLVLVLVLPVLLMALLLVLGLREQQNARRRGCCWLVRCIDAGTLLRERGGNAAKRCDAVARVYCEVRIRARAGHLGANFEAVSRGCGVLGGKARAEDATCGSVRSSGAKMRARSLGARVHRWAAPTGAHGEELGGKRAPVGGADGSEWLGAWGQQREQGCLGARAERRARALR